MLDLDGNQLSSLPPEIGALNTLAFVDLDSNPLPQSYFDALEDGIPNFLALLASFEGDTAPIYEAKLVITGEGQVGKSWALAALHGQDPGEVIGTDNTTWGIDRGDLALPHPNQPGTDIHLNS